jgi:F-type H+-transporting ATPase subunit gamma
VTTQDPRLAERINSVQQLSGVVGAMRGIAAAHAQHARHQLEGIRAYADIIADAISQALTLEPASSAVRPTQVSGQIRACVMFCSEQGFVGAFNDHVCEAAQPLLAAGGQAFVIGQRGTRLLGTLGYTTQWSSPMIAQAGNARNLADRVGKALVEALTAGRIGGADLVHTISRGSHLEVVRQSLLPLDPTVFQRHRAAAQPMTYLPAPVLLRQLAGEYLFAQLVAATVESHVAENQARMQAMAAAQDNIAHRLEHLRLDQQIQRQDAITDELVELASGVL